MKYVINGVPAEIQQSENVEITNGVDRLYVRTEMGTHSAVSVRVGSKIVVSYAGRIYEIEKVGAVRATGAVASGELRASMPGSIVDVMVAEGDEVKKGQKLLVLEAMKTQQPQVSPFDGVVSRLPVQKGQQVSENDVLVTVKPV